MFNTVWVFFMDRRDSRGNRWFKTRKRVTVVALFDFRSDKSSFVIIREQVLLSKCGFRV